MKRSLMLVMMLVTVLNIVSSDLIIYKTVGVIKKKVSTSWAILDKQSVVNDMDVVQIGKNSSLSLLDKAENRVYIYDVEGEWILSDIIKKCRKDNLNMTNRIIVEAKKQIIKGQQKSYTTIGGVKRDACDEEVLESIYGQLCKYIDAPNILQPSSCTVLKKICNDDNTFYFEIANIGGTTMYANVLYHPKQTSSWRILYECSSDYPCLEIPAGSTIEMKHERMIDKKGCYILFSTNVQFDSNELMYMFKENMEPEDVREGILIVNISGLYE